MIRKKNARDEQKTYSWNCEDVTIRSQLSSMHLGPKRRWFIVVNFIYQVLIKKIKFAKHKIYNSVNKYISNCISEFNKARDKIKKIRHKSIARLENPKCIKNSSKEKNYVDKTSLYIILLNDSFNRSRKFILDSLLYFIMYSTFVNAHPL